MVVGHRWRETQAGDDRRPRDGGHRANCGNDQSAAETTDLAERDGAVARRVWNGGGRQWKVRRAAQNGTGCVHERQRGVAVRFNGGGQIEKPVAIGSDAGPELLTQNR